MRQLASTFPSVSAVPAVRPTQGFLQLLAECFTKFRSLATKTLLLVAALSQGSGAIAADWLYTVRPGDKLWVLSEKYCGTPDRWRDLAVHNQLEDPTRLQAGSQIGFPLAWLMEEAAVVRVVYSRGVVTIESPAAEGDVVVTRATQGAEMGVGSKLVTGANSYANVQFADGSSMQIAPESEVVFDTLSAYRDTGMVDSRIRFNRGSGNSAVKPQDGPGSVYRISTPLGVAAVRGTEFRTRSDGGASFVETLGGAVDFITPVGTSAVGRGFGLKADAQGSTVEALLAPPKLRSAHTYNVAETIGWDTLAGAATYLVKIYSGLDLAQVLTSATVTDPQHVLSGLTPGSYAIGVSGVAASGLRGYEATQALVLQSAIAAPQDVIVRQMIGTKALSISWKAVPGAAEYTVTATPKGSGQVIVRTTAETHLLLPGLKLDDFTITVKASAIDGGVGKVSAPVQPYAAA